MDHLFLYCLASGIIVVFLVFAVRVAVRWIVRLALVGLLLSAIGGAAWWWSSRAKPEPDNRPRPAITGRASSDRR